MCRSQTLEQEGEKLKLHSIPQGIRDVRAMGYLLRKAVNREWNQPKRKICVVVNKAEKTGDMKRALTSLNAVWSLPSWFSVLFGLLFSLHDILE
jgi:hypothetical protein